MPNDALIDKVLTRAATATPSERLVLKIAASLLKQLDQNYKISEDTDERIKLSREEMGWTPDAFEVWNSILRPKRWEYQSAWKRSDERKLKFRQS